jgi:spermidine synthase
MSRIVESVDSGQAELVRDPDGGWTLLLDGVEQSYVHPERPTQLDFSYMRRLASVIDTVAGSLAPQRILHLGGGALSLPRYVVATHPGSTQVVVEHDRALIAMVARVLGLPPGVTVHIADARAFVEANTERFDIVIADVYRGAQMAPSVSSVQFMHHIQRALSERGVFAVNVTDLPPVTLSRVYAATLRACFPDLCLIAEPGLLRGRRYGNVVLAASAKAHTLPVARLTRLAAADPERARVVHGEALDDFIGATGPRIEAW